MPTTSDFLNLENKVAIITGAATGLGAATAILLSQAGAKVVINHMPGQEDLAHNVAKNCVNGSLCYAADITQDDQCKAMAQATINQWGQIDSLINNAGINKPVNHHDLEGLSAEDFFKIYSVNVVGAFQMIRAVAPCMQSQGKGTVVNISSCSGENGNGSSVAYSASKGAINTMTKTLGRALAPNIRVNAVAPGFIATELWDKFNFTPQEREQQRQANIAETPLQVEATPELIARTVLLLVSDLSAHLTGQIITSDGGMLLGVYQPWLEDNNGGEE